MSKIYGYIFKNKFRLAKGIIKHNLMGLLGLLVVGGLALSQAIRFAAYLEPGRPLDNRYVCYMMAALAALGFYRAFFMQSPVIVINAATLHHTFYTRYFKTIMMWQYLRLAFRSLVIAGIAAYIIAGRTLNIVFATTCILLFAYLSLSELLAWIAYHTSGSRARLLGLMCLNVVCILAGGYSIATAGTTPLSGGPAGGLFSGLLGKLAKPCLAVAFLAVELIAVLGYLKRKFQPDYSKYEAYLRFVDETMAAQSQNNWAKMVQIAKEYSLKREYRIMLHRFQPKRHNVLVYKNIIKTPEWEEQSSLSSWLSCLHTSLQRQRGYPGINEVSWVRQDHAVHVATVFANLKEIWLRQANSAGQVFAGALSAEGRRYSLDTCRFL